MAEQIRSDGVDASKIAATPHRERAEYSETDTLGAKTMHGHWIPACCVNADSAKVSAAEASMAKSIGARCLELNSAEENCSRSRTVTRRSSPVRVLEACP